MEMSRVVFLAAIVILAAVEARAQGDCRDVTTILAKGR